MALDLTPRRFLFLDVAMKYGVWAGETRPTQFYDAINFTKLAITPPKQETKRIISRMEGSVGNALAVVQRPSGEPATLAAAFDAAPVGFIALALGATVSELAVATKTVTDAEVTTVLGLWVPLPDQWITASSFVLKTGATTIQDSKYELDVINGLIKATHADAVGAKLASYSVAATGGEVYAAGQAISSNIYLIGTGTEQATQRRCRLIIEKATLAASAAFDLSGGEALSGELSGDLSVPTDRNSPWSYTYSDLAA